MKYWGMVSKYMEKNNDFYLMKTIDEIDLILDYSKDLEIKD